MIPPHAGAGSAISPMSLRPTSAMYHRPMPDRPECTLVLASASPRRRRLISWLGLPVQLTAVETPEELDSPLAANPQSLASHLAAEKARAALAARVAVPDNGVDADHLGGEPTALGPASCHDLILAFDTIVVLDGRILGKPADVDDAWLMLRALSGRTHEVVTGVELLGPDDDEPRAFAVTTRVRMKRLTDADIERWMAKGEFMGCAGAYNIEGQVAEVDADECFQNVAGLPLCHVYAALASAWPEYVAERLTSPVKACDEALTRACELGPRLA